MSFVANTTPWPGGTVSQRTFCLRADNASPMTYTGTNTWVIAEPECSECIVIDPAPAGEHVRNLLRAVADHGLRVSAILTTHNHEDHTEGVTELHAATGASVYSAADGSLPAGAFAPIPCGPQLEIVPLPGHSSDSVGILYAADHCMFTGDVLFLQGPTVVFYPDGVLADYLQSLDKLQAIVDEGVVTTFYTGHGYPINNPTDIIKATRAHRLERLEQITEALQSGVARNADALVDAVYADTDPRLRPASLKSVQAQLKYLNDTQQ